MNERIKLPDQEWLGYDPEKGDIHGYTSEQMYWLADRIVQECADYFGREGDHRFEVNGNWIAKTIKQHFGVDE